MGKKKFGSEKKFGLKKIWVKKKLDKKNLGKKKIWVNFFLLHFSNIGVKIRLNAENQLPTCPGSGLKVCGGGVCVGGCVVASALSIEVFPIGLAIEV